MRTAVLHGAQHTQLGSLATAPCGQWCAVGNTRGRHPKRYGHVDPNEDIAAVAGDDHTSLLVVADAHNGIDAADAVVNWTMRNLGDPLPAPEISDAHFVATVTEAGQAAWNATRAQRYPRRGSRTALGIVLVTSHRVQWATVGDVAVITGGSTPAAVRNAVQEIFLGGPLEEDHVKKVIDIGSAPLQPGDWVVVASDGLLNFSSVERVDLALAGHGRPEEMARRLLELACDGGAGDNVAVALWATPAPEPGPGADPRRNYS